MGQKKPKSLAADLPELFAMLRSGAANVAGVTYQVALSAMLLAAGRAGTVTGLPVRSVIPENLEDVDCRLADGVRLLVQSKERGPGPPPLRMPNWPRSRPTRRRLSSSATSRGPAGRERRLHGWRW